MALYNARLISENTFSFYLVPSGETSKVDFGQPVLTRIKPSNQVQYIPLLEDFFWSAHCTGFALGTYDNAWQWGSIKDQYVTVSDGSVYSIFDSGASAIIFPQDYFSNFLETLFTGMAGNSEYEVAAGYVLTKCYDDFPSVFF